MKTIFTFCVITLLTISILQAQEKTTMEVKDLQSTSTKYIKKNYKDFTTTEAYQFNPIYAVNIQNGDTTKGLAFDNEGKFIYIMNEEMESKVSMQPNIKMAIADLDKGIDKYVKKNYEGYKIISAINYQMVYSAKVVKGSEEVVLLFNESGEFMQLLNTPNE